MHQSKPSESSPSVLKGYIVAETAGLTNTQQTVEKLFIGYMISNVYYTVKLFFVCSALKGKFHYSLPRNLKFSNFEFSLKNGKLSTFIGSTSSTVHFFVDKIFIFLPAGITSFAILISVDWCAVRIIPEYIFLFR